MACARPRRRRTPWPSDTRPGSSPPRSVAPPDPHPPWLTSTGTEICRCQTSRLIDQPWMRTMAGASGGPAVPTASRTCHRPCRCEKPPSAGGLRSWPRHTVRVSRGSGGSGSGSRPDRGRRSRGRRTGPSVPGSLRRPSPTPGRRSPRGPMSRSSALAGGPSRGGRRSPRGPTARCRDRRPEAQARC
jgi:hypothetical protein